MAKIYKGKRVSDEIYVILTAAEKDIFFQLNSGQRSKAEQLDLIKRKGLWSPSNRTGAAPYSPNAPHIKTPWHSLDVDTYRNGANNLVAWLRRNGVRAELDVPGEPWHVTIKNTEAASRLVKRLLENEKWEGYTDKEISWIKEYDKLKREARNISRRQVLRREMKKQRKRIWRAAQITGWKRHNRLARYKSLKARSE